MNRPTVLVTRRLPEAVEAHLARHYDVTLNPDDRPLARSELIEAFCRYDALVPTITDRIDAALIANPERRVRILANFGAGLDHIDLDAARSAGLTVTNTPDALTEATAEIAILLMLMAARRASEGERELRRGAWTGWRPTHLVGQGLAGKTLGLVGFGRIAQSTAAKARAFGMNIAFFNRSTPPTAIATALMAERVPTLEALAARADVLSLHVPGGTDTRHLIDAALIRHLKPGMILVNTARGTILDEEAVADGLERGGIGAVALDVYAQEPMINPRLLAHPRSVLLPHLGSATIETRTAMGMQVAANLDAFFDNGQAPNRVA
jgi:lactate dehydrogenase-like 2-hydroxyacid dehydrogenase